MKNKLQQYFPMICSKEEIMDTIESKEHLKNMFYLWPKERRLEFLNFCTGVKGVKTMYDFISKEILNPEYTPERVNELLSLLLNQEVRILEVLPNDSTRIADELSLVIMDIVVQLEDGSIANLEIQKIGYHFPGERSACYSADLLLRQYKRVRSRKKEKFTYKDIKRVYTIVLFENSPAAFHEFPDTYLHHFEQTSDTGLEIDLLQKYLFVPLDIFREIHQNENRTITINNRLEAWLAFMCIDEPEAVITIIKKYPDFKAIYEQIYDICRNIEEVMSMFSEELRELDRNTVQLMIDEMQEELNQDKKQMEQMSQELDHTNQKLDQANQERDQANQERDQANQKLNQANQKSKAERLTGIANIIELCRELDLSLEITEQKVMQKYSLSENEAHEYMSVYWKTSE